MSLKKIIISGAVGVGKSTLINLLKSKYNFSKVIGEFSVTEKGHKELLDRLNGKMSVLEFQKHIIDYYIDSQNENNNTGLTLIERNGDDCYFCFGKIAYENNEITKDELKELKNYSKKFSTKYNKNNVHFIKFDTSLLDINIISDVIINLIISDKIKCETLLVGLIASADICHKRIIDRGYEQYDYKTVKRFCNICNEYFKETYDININIYSEMYKLESIYKITEKIIRDSSEIVLTINIRDDEELLKTHEVIVNNHLINKLQYKTLIKNLKKKIVKEENNVNDDSNITTNDEDYLNNINNWSDACINFFTLFNSKYSGSNQAIINDSLKCIYNCGKLKFMINH